MEVGGPAYPDPVLRAGDLRAALDGVVRDSLRPVAGGLAGLFLFFAFSHAIFLPPAIAPAMVGLALGTAIGMFALWWALGQRPMPAAWAHPIGAGVGGMVLINGLIHMYLAADPKQTTDVALLVIGLGCFFLSDRWLAAGLVASLGGNLTVALLLPPAPDWSHYGFLLVAATVLSVLAHTTRVRTFRRLVRLHLRDTQQQTELHSLVAAMQQSEARFRRLAEAPFEGIAIHDQGIILDVNSTLAAMAGYAPAQMIGRSALEMAAPEYRTRILQKIASGSDTPYQVEALRRDGTRFPVEIRGSAIPYQGRMMRVVAIRDITAQRQAEARLRAAKEEAEAASRAKSQFLANMSHELRTPLNIILGYSEMLQEELAAEDNQARVADLARIIEAGRHLLVLIEDVLDLARLDTNKLEITRETFPIRSLVDGLVPTAQAQTAQHGNRLVMECPVDSGDLYSDPHRLRQVLLHLLSNAAKFTEEGTITLAVSRSPDMVYFRVADTGIGMTSDQVVDLFQPFTQADGSPTRKYGGSGLGLALSRRLCRALGGEITVESHLGQGSVFTICLPALLPASDLAGMAPAGSTCPFSPGD